MDNILKQYCAKHDIVLRKGENWHIVFTLAWNYVLLAKLRLYKWLHGIHKPIVHYYAVCWNEEKMLPFMFQHYDQFVDYYTIYDNYSDDSSEEIILLHGKADIEKFSMNNQIDDHVYQQIKNNCWRHSRGKADWVVVCDVDEFLYSPDMLHSLSLLRLGGFSVVKPFAYNMYSREFPRYSNDTPLTRLVPKGLRAPIFDKCILFDPHAIVDINYDPGAHVCHPVGKVRSYRSEDIKLLHYKNIGLEKLLARNRLYAVRLSKENVENNYGIEYLRKEQQIIQEFTDNEQRATEII